MLTRYQSLPPQQSTGLVVPRVVEMHAGDASFLWSIRRKAVLSQKYRLPDLVRADERVEAHLEGIQVAAADGWARLVDEIELGLPGAVFAGAVWAMRAGDDGRLGAVLDSAQDDRLRLDAIVSGFGWVWSGGTADDRPALAPMLVGPRNGVAAQRSAPSSGPPADTWARRLLADSSGPSRYVAVGAFAACRTVPSNAEVSAMLLKEPFTPAVARAARMVGENGMAPAAALLEHLLAHKEPEVRQAAAWSMAILRPENKAFLPILVSAAQDQCPNADILEMAGRKLPLAHLRTWAAALVKAGRARAALIASAAGGAPVMIDEILPHMAEPKTARIAGFAFSQITGADLVKLDLESQDKATPDDDLEQLDEEAPSEDEEADSHLPIPDPALVARWWRDHKGELSAAPRYLAGRPMTEPGLRQTLVEGTQPQRRAAAVELACLTPGPVYNTSQPGFVQARDLLGWT